MELLPSGCLREIHSSSSIASLDPYFPTSLFLQLKKRAYCQARSRLPEKLLEKLFSSVAQKLQDKRPLAEIIQRVPTQSCTGQQSDCSVTQSAALDCGIAQLKFGKSSTAD